LNPLHFGVVGRVLFGVYHPPRRSTASTEGVVVCPPLGGDYLRTHRTLRVLAARIAEEGRHVLRFDYYGTGDSDGCGTAVRLAGCVADAVAAAEELRMLASLSRVSLVGVRAGGTVALLAAREGWAVERVVVWDPVVRGRAYLEDLRKRASEPAVLPARFGRGRAPDGVLGVDGFPLTPELRRELESVELTDVDEIPARFLGLVRSDMRESDARGLARRAEELGLEVARRDCPDPGVWTDRRRLGEQVLAPGVVEALPRWLA